VDKAFPIAFSTIVKADVASLIGAGLLWALTVGAVRGFALYLGLATTRWFAEHPQRFGLPASGAVGATGGRASDAAGAHA